MWATQVRNAEHLATVERLREQIAGREPWPIGDDTRRRFGDDTGRLVDDPADRGSHVWLAFDGDLPVGTIRAISGAECNLERVHPEFGLGPFVDAVGPERLVVYSRFMILPEYRTSLASPLLMKEVADFTLRRDTDVAFYACEPRVVPFYESLGFRRYRPVGDQRPAEGRVPMVLVFSDRDHLTKVGSPVRHRVPTSMPTTIEPALAGLIGCAAGTGRPRSCRRASSASTRDPHRGWRPTAA